MATMIEEELDLGDVAGADEVDAWSGSGVEGEAGRRHLALLMARVLALGGERLRARHGGAYDAVGRDGRASPVADLADLLVFAVDLVPPGGLVGAA